LELVELKEKLFEFPGQGRKPINKKGIIDNTVIYDTSNWPKSCK
jgi:hypothetical protein